MTLMRWDPFRSMVNVRRELDRYFNEYEDDAPTHTSAWRPTVDIFETKDNLVMRAEIPGVEKKDVKINVENDLLTVSGEKKFSDEINKDNYHRIERCYGSFFRSFTLPTRVDRDRIEARYDNGVLEVIMPKKEEAKPKQIDIRVK